MLPENGLPGLAYTAHHVHVDRWTAHWNLKRDDHNPDKPRASYGSVGAGRAPRLVPASRDDPAVSPAPLAAQSAAVRGLETFLAEMAMPQAGKAIRQRPPASSGRPASRATPEVCRMTMFPTSWAQPGWPTEILGLTAPHRLDVDREGTLTPCPRGGHAGSAATRTWRLSDTTDAMRRATSCRFAPAARIGPRRS